MSATAFQRMRREQENKRLQELEKAKPKSLVDLKVAELKQLAKEKGIKGFDNMKKPDLLEALAKVESDNKEPENESKGAE